MKTEPLEILAPLQKADSFKGKIDALIEYLYPGAIECTVKETIENPIESSSEKYTVLDLYIPGGNPSYINSYLKTSWEYLSETLDKELDTDNGYQNTRSMLLQCRQQCHLEIEKYEFDDPYTFEAIHSVVIRTGTDRYPAFLENLVLNTEHWTEMRDHCLVRRSFLKKLYNYIDEALLRLTNIPEKHNLVEWNSDKAELEITELLYALKLTGRISLKDEITEVQFREKFFNFFGLNEKEYNKRVTDIKRRKKRPLLLNELSDAIEDAM